MRVTMKVKTFVKITISLCVSLILLFLLLPKFQSQHTNASYEIPWDNPDELYKLAMETRPPETNTMTVFPSFSNYSLGTYTVTTEEGIEYLEYLIKEYPIFYQNKNDINWNLALLYLRQGEVEKAIHYFQLIDETIYSHDNSAKKLLTALQDSLEIDPTEQTLSLTGKVMIGDQPASNMFVVLRKREDNGWGTPFFHNYYPFAYLNKNGEYRFYDIEPGEYEIGISFQPEQVNGYYLPTLHGTYITITEAETLQYDLSFVPQIQVLEPSNHEVIMGDTIQFRWEPYPEAAYYLVMLTMFDDQESLSGSSHGIRLVDKWTETTATYSIPELREKWHGSSKSGNTETSYLSPTSILGQFYPGGRFSWSVEAYTVDGQRLSSSAGYYLSGNSNLPLFTTDDAEQLEGDRYVLNKEYDKAIASYEREGDNPYALRALARMFYYGLTIEDDGDKSKALRYLLRIPNPSKGDLQAIADSYQEIGEYAKAKEIYLSLIEAGDDWGSYVNIAKILNLEGDRKGAITYYEKVLQADSGNYSSNNLVVLYLLEHEYDEALRIAKDHPYKYYQKSLYPFLVAVQEHGWDHERFYEVLEAINNKENEQARNLITQFSKEDQAYVEFLNVLGTEMYGPEFTEPDFGKGFRR